jgi:biotin carboxyl carrier protein
VRDGEVITGGRTWTGASIRFDAGGAARIALDGVERRYAVHATEEAIWIARDGHHLELRTERSGRVGEAGLVDSLEAPMPGTVLLVHVADGDAVAEGDVLMVLESMKMELSITAPHAGVVDGVTLRPGDRVGLKQPLLVVHPNGSEAGA